MLINYGLRAIIEHKKRGLRLSTLQGPRNCPQKLISRRPRKTQTFADLFVTFAFQNFLGFEAVPNK